MIESPYEKALEHLVRAEKREDVQQNALLAIAYALCDIAGELERLKLTVDAHD